MNRLQKYGSVGISNAMIPNQPFHRFTSKEAKGCTHDPAIGDAIGASMVMSAADAQETAQ